MTGGGTTASPASEVVYLARQPAPGCPPQHQRRPHRPRRQAVVQRRRQRPDHHQRRDPDQRATARSCGSTSTARSRADNPFVQRPGRRPVHLRLRPAQPVPVHLPARRPGHDRGHRLELLGRDGHDPARRQLRLGLLRRQLLQLRLHQPGLCLRPPARRRRRVGDGRLLGHRLPDGSTPTPSSSATTTGIDIEAVNFDPTYTTEISRHRLRQQRRHHRRPPGRPGRQPLLRLDLRRPVLEDLPERLDRPDCGGLGYPERRSWRRSTSSSRRPDRATPTGCR